MKVFISGPMTGVKDYNRPAFNEMESKLKKYGHSVFNPAWLLFDDEWGTEDILPIDLAALDKCDAIMQLDGWENSNGATAEYAFAKATGKIIVNPDRIRDITPFYAEYQ